MGENKKPVQARSIQTRENLLKAAIAMYSKKGYHKTTVDEIAAEAGLSTGIAYRYFKNKKDMLLSAITYATEDLGSFVHIERPEVEAGGDMREYLRNVLIGFERLHSEYHDIHEELEGLRHTDEDVRQLYNNIAMGLMERVIDKLREVIGARDDIRERAYTAIGIMEQHCHIKMNGGEPGLDNDIMRELTVAAVMTVLE